MKSAVLKFIAIAAMHVACIAAAQAQTTAGPNRPNTVPQGYVVTPFGYFHPDCINHLAEGDVVRRDQQAIQHRNGTTAQIPACAYPHYRGDGEAVFGDERAVKSPNISHSWIVSESVTTRSSYGQLFGEWSVPPAPPSNDSQTLFYFTGLEDINDVVTILQPVLGWNADFGSAWGIASWNCCVNGAANEGPAQPVNPGDTILGSIWYTCPVGTRNCSSWEVITQDLQNGKSSFLNMTSSYSQTFNWAFGGVLEVYNVIQCSDYPNNPNGITGGSHSISFNALALFNDKIQQVANPAWSLTVEAAGLTPQCNYGGSVPKQVILNYGPGAPTPSGPIAP
jgi:hypothetical protein